MDGQKDSETVGRWSLTRTPAPAGPGAPAAALNDAETLARWAEAEFYRYALGVHDAEQARVPARLEGLRHNPGMGISARTGKLVSRLPYQNAVQEIAFARGISAEAARPILDRAEVLATDLPEVLTELGAGRIGAQHTVVTADLALEIVPRRIEKPTDPDDRAAWEEFARRTAAEERFVRAARNEFGKAMLHAAPGKGPGQLRGYGRELLQKHLPESFTTRHQKAAEHRNVRLEPASDGMCFLTAYLPAADGEAIYNFITNYAQTLKKETTSPDTGNSEDATSGAEETANATGGTEEAADNPGGHAGPAIGGNTSGADDTADAGSEGEEAGSKESRTMDQLRADALRDAVLLGPHGGGLDNVHAEVIITVPSTLFPGLHQRTTNTSGSDATSGTANDGNAANGAAGANQQQPAGAGTAGHDETAQGSSIGNGTTRCGENAVSGAAFGSGWGEGVLFEDVVLPAGAEVPAAYGVGPIDQHSAARLLHGARTWQRILVDPWDGAVVRLGRHRYRPSRAQRTALLLIRRTCATPGCNRQVNRCEPDHVTEWQDGGTTDLDNLSGLCKRCHRLKSLGQLETTLRPDGTLIVTTPQGTTRTSPPDRPWRVPDPDGNNDNQDDNGDNGENGDDGDGHEEGGGKGRAGKARRPEPEPLSFEDSAAIMELSWPLSGLHGPDHPTPPRTPNQAAQEFRKLAAHRPRHGTTRDGKTGTAQQARPPKPRQEAGPPPEPSPPGDHQGPTANPGYDPFAGPQPHPDDEEPPF